MLHLNFGKEGVCRENPCKFITAGAISRCLFKKEKDLAAWKKMFKLALEVIPIGTFLSMERENSVFQISNTPELWPSALSVLSVLCAQLCMCLALCI